MDKSRVAILGAVCAVCVAAPIIYALLTRGAQPAQASGAVVDAAALAAVAGRPHLQFRDTAPGPGYGMLSVAALDDLAGRHTTPLHCDRVYFSAGSGMCLTADRGVVTTYRADVYDATFVPRRSIPFAGVPSRTRVAPHGQLASMTYFVSGDSYAAGGFSTRTFIVDPTNGQMLLNLEDLNVTRNGEAFKAVDFNFWGVTFASDPDRFYATLASGGQTYLVEASLARRSARVLRDRLECPSLSPDGGRIAFKRRMPGMQLLWRVYVLDLATGRESETAETRNVDDQMEWLDDDTILYALPSEKRMARDIWSVRADGTGQPALFLENAESPAVVR